MQSFNLKSDQEKNYRKTFKNSYSTVILEVKDTISADPVNTAILKVIDKSGKTLGFVREIVTTTGCNSSCLPIFATLFYSKNKTFMTLKSRQGLTKKNHESFSELDYQKLELILVQNPKQFIKVRHPKEMVDAITSETLKVFSSVVVERAAYTTLRLNLYNQDTLKALKNIN